MITDLTEIRRLAEAQESANLDFRRHLTAHHPPPHLLEHIAAGVSAQIDCTACANCCRQTVVEVTETEIEELARHLTCAAAEVVHEYVDVNPATHERTLRQAHGECVFLDGNLCLVYDARPSACRDFPHLVLTHSTLGGRMSSIERNAWLCPIIFNTLDAFKKALGFH